MTFRARSGVVYVAILIVCVVLLIGISIYHISMRQGRMAAYRSLDTQYAQNLARAGANLAQASLAQALHDPASLLRKKLLEPIANIRAAPGGVFELEARPRDLAADFPTVVDELTAELPGGRASLSSLTVRFFVPADQVKPLPALPLSGKTLDRGGIEKAGRLFLECTASLDTGSLLGRITQQVVAYQEFRVVHAPVPLLSDFTLFLRDVPNAADERSPANALEATQLGLLDPTSGTPLVLDNGRKFVQRIASSELKPELLRDQGWVFLGGNSVVLNLSYSQDETANPRSVGEDFHFYQQDPTDLEAGRANSDDALSTRANQHLGGNNFWQVRTWDMGVHSLKDGDLKAQYEQVFQKTPQGRRLGSILKLFGAAPDNVSPTVVFGHVLAGYFRISAVVPANPDQTDFEAFYTILKDPGGSMAGFLAILFGELRSIATRLLYVFDRPFLSGRYVFLDPDNPQQLRGLGQGASEDAYREISGGFKTRAYNAGLLHLKAGNQVPNPRDRFTQLGLPESLFSDDLARPEPNQLPGNLLPPPWATTLDKVDLSGMNADAIADALDRTCCFRSGPQDQAASGGLDTLRGLNMLRGDRLDLGSTVSITGQLRLPALAAIERGGMIVANDIVIEGAIPRPATGVLVLVARQGGIRFPGGATQINASLVALKGALTPGGPPNVRGNLVGNTLDFAGLAGGGTGGAASLAYEPKLKQKPVGPGPVSDGFVVDFSRRFIRVD